MCPGSAVFSLTMKKLHNWVSSVTLTIVFHTRFKVILETVVYMFTLKCAIPQWPSRGSLMLTFTMLQQNLHGGLSLCQQERSVVTQWGVNTESCQWEVSQNKLFPQRNRGRKASFTSLSRKEVKLQTSLCFKGLRHLLLGIQIVCSRADGNPWREVNILDYETFKLCLSLIVGVTVSVTQNRSHLSFMFAVAHYNEQWLIES